MSVLKSLIDLTKFNKKRGSCQPKDDKFPLHYHVLIE